ncbi:MAG: PAS domain S-box protein, partial [Nitrospirae bacterium]
MPEGVNKNCALVRMTGKEPFRRCRRCERPIWNCFSFRTSVLSIAVIGLAFYLTDLGSLSERIILGGIVLLIVLMGALIFQETDNLVEAEYRARESLKEKEKAEARYRALFDDASDAIYIIDPKTGKILDTNYMASKMTGYSRTELRGMNVADINPLSEKVNIKKRIIAQLRGETLQFETKHIRKDGGVIDVEVTSKVIRQNGEKVLQAFVRDVSKKKRAEREAEELLKLINSMMEHMPEGVFLIDQDGTIIHANDRGKEYLLSLQDLHLGDTVKEIMGRPVEEYMVSPPQIAWHEIKTEKRVYEIGGRRLKTEGLIEGMVFVIRDVTDMREREERMKTHERLASVGQLASGIAHDFNNLLTIIMGCAENLADKELPDTAGYEVQAIMESGEKASRMIRQILDFSRHRGEDMVITDIKEVIKEFEVFIRRLLPEDIKIEFKIGGGEMKLKSNPTKLHQMLANLVINSRDAMPGGGVIYVSLKEEKLDYPLPSTGMSPGRYIKLEVKDTGMGIPDEVKEHIFEPFFTTKGKRGTGLGLSQVYGIVKQHGGFIDFKSEEKRGTSFVIYLPALSVEGEIEAKRIVDDIPDGKGERILIVEDESELARMLKTELEKHGYTVDVAADGEKGLLKIVSMDGGYDLVITDMMMPEMGGKTLIEKAKAEFPDLRFIVMT